MPTQCNAEQLQFSCVERRRVVAAFDGGTVSSDAGALLLGRTDAVIGLIDRLATPSCIDPADQKFFSASFATFLSVRRSSHLLIMTSHDQTDITMRMTNTALPT